MINAFHASRKEYPDDATLYALACKVTRKLKITKKGDNNKENLTIPKAIWDHLEPHIWRQIALAREQIQEMQKKTKLNDTKKPSKLDK